MTMETKMKHIKRFNESTELLQNQTLKEDIEGLTTYLSDEYDVNVVTNFDKGKFEGIYVSLQILRNVDYDFPQKTLFETNKEIKDCFDTIVDYTTYKFDNLQVGYYYSGSYEDYLSEDFHYDKFLSIELVIEDKYIGPYFNEYKINIK